MDVKLIFILICLGCLEASKILVVAPFYGKSHSIFIHSIVSGITHRGHDVTMISTNLIKNPPKNLRQIQIDKNINSNSKHLYNINDKPILQQMFHLWNRCIEETEICFNSSEVIEFLKEDNHFDLVMVELFFQESLYMFAHKYNAPLILLGSTDLYDYIEDYTGNPSTVSYLTSEFSKYNGELDIYQKTINYLVSIIFSLGSRFYLSYHHSILAERYFKNSNLPSIHELREHASVFMMNSHFTLDSSRPLVPGVVEIGGIHIKPPKSLPKDIQTFLDEAEDGAIFFSFGTYLKVSEIPEEKFEIILKVFKTLKQRILWKWESDIRPLNATNIYFSDWMPQSDILAHPNLRLFISHGGMMSTQEAASRGVPILGLTVYGDQHMNMAKMTEHGVGLNIPLNRLTEVKLTDALNDILNNPKYMRNMKKLSKRYNDRQNTQMDTVNYWTEYVIRHRNMRFLKSKLVNLTWYQRWMLDIYFLLLITALVLYKIISIALNSILYKARQNVIVGIFSFFVQITFFYTVYFRLNATLDDYYNSI